MGYDAAETASIIAELVARSDDGRFDLTVTATALDFVAGHPAAESLRPPRRSGAQRYLVEWRAVYRLRRLGGRLVVVLPDALLAQGILVASARDTFNALDLKLSGLGVPIPASSA